MPRSAPRRCSFATCSTLAKDLSGRCQVHSREPWIKATPTKRITGRRLQGLRTALFARDPLCVECRRHGRATPATERDHIVPLSDGGPDDSTNEQGLCAPCHEAKSKAESKRGRWGCK